MRAPRNGNARRPGEGAPPRVSFVERALAHVAPKLARTHYEERLRLWGRQLAALRYEAADVGRRTGDWRPTGSSADLETASSLLQLRNRSRALVRDRGWGRRVINVWTSFLVGTGWQPAFEDGDLREQPWEDWAGEGSTECDACGQHEFFALLRVAVRCWLESGAALVVRRFAPEKAGVPVEFAVYEPDYLDWSRDGRAADGGVVVQGVQYGRTGKLEGYWLLREHPGSAVLSGFAGGTAGLSDFFPAEDVVHLYLLERAGQVSGVPIMHAIILALHDWTDMTDAKLLQQKNAAAFGWVEHDLSTDPPQSPLPDGQRPARVVEPGSVLTADAGRTIEPMPTPDPGPFEELASEFLHELGGGVDLPFSVFTGHLGEMSFSTARAALIPFLRVRDGMMRAALVPRLLRPVFRWFVEGARLRGMKGFADPRAHLVDWNPPPAPQLDPKAENEVDVADVRAGFRSLSSVLRGRGLHRRRHLEAVRNDQKLLDELGLVIDPDPRKFGPPGASAGWDVAAAQAAADTSPPAPAK